MRDTIMVIFLAWMLAGCNSEEDKNEQPTDRNISFRLYPSDFFDSDYQENYAISGMVKRSNTVPITGSLISKPNGLTSFDSTQAQSVYSTTTIKENSTGALITASGNDYYSTDISQMHYLGSLVNGVYQTARSSSVIPTTAKVGDIGIVGEYINSADSNVENIGWELQDGYNGRAKLVFKFSEYYDNLYFGQTSVSSSVESYLITPEGNRLSISLDRTDHQKNIITKVSGERE